MYISTLTFYDLLPLLNIMQSVSNSIFFYSWMILAILVLFKTYPCSQLPFFCIFLFMIPQFQPLISTKIDHGAKCILVGTEVFLVCNIPVFLCFLIYFCHFFITPTNTSWFSFIKVFLPLLLLIFCACL